MSLNFDKAKNSKTAKLLVGVYVVTFMLSMTVQPLVFSAYATPAPKTTVTICHTGNDTNGHYVTETPSISSHGGLNIQGHENHNSDIIPSFDYLDDNNVIQTYLGKNWDANGQAIYNNGGCDGTVAPTTYTLTLSTSGSGSGTVGGAGTFSSGSTAPITATANTGSTFTGWSGDAGCSTGSVLMDANKTCTATFTLNTYTLTVNTAGTGAGSVTGAGTFSYGSTAPITATPDGNSTFDGWSGATDCTTESVLMDSDKTCTATFSPKSTQTIYYDLDVTISNGDNDGEGTVVDSVVESDPQINCDSTLTETDCSGNYPSGTEITLTATPKEGSTFEGSWTSGPCAISSPTNPVCTFIITGPTTANAHFSLVTTPTTPPTPTPTPPGGGGGGCSGCSPYTPPSAPPVVLGAVDTPTPTPTPQVLGATTLPDTGFSFSDSVTFSLFMSFVMTGMVMMMIGFGAVPAKLEEYLS